MGSMGDLFMMLFLGIISWKGASRFNGGSCFSDGGASYLSEGVGGGFKKKIVGWGEGHPPMLPPLWETLPVGETLKYKQKRKTYMHVIFCIFHSFAFLFYSII